MQKREVLGLGLIGGTRVVLSRSQVQYIHLD